MKFDKLLMIFAILTDVIEQKKTFGKCQRENDKVSSSKCFLAEFVMQFWISRELNFEN